MNFDYTELLNRAIPIAENGSAVAYSYFRKALLIESKADESPVTIADRKTEESMRKAIQSEFPGHGILGEEFGEDSIDAEFVWTIDPIDGTRSFIRGIPLWGTLLGLLHDNDPVLGIMVLPALDEIYYATTDEAFCNGASISVSPTKKIEEALVCHGDLYSFKGKEGNFLKQLQEKAALTRGYTDCFAHSLVLRGAADVMIDPVVAPWDIVPIACILEAAGGEFLQFEEKSILKNPSSFIACAPNLKEPLEKLLAQS